MKQEPYVPSPVDTSGVAVPEELESLGELMAKNTHEIWAKQRMSQGWRYGEKRDDSLLLHPDLMPYEDLPDQEKEYDRVTSMETIRLILSLGYRIEKR